MHRVGSPVSWSRNERGGCRITTIADREGDGSKRGKAYSSRLVGSSAMRGLIKEFAEGIFAPDQVRLLTDAFDDAWSRVQASKAPWAIDDYAKVGRTIIAKHIKECTVGRI